MSQYVGVLLLSAFAFSVCMLLTRRRRIQKAARRIQEHMDHACVPRHEYRLVDARDFPHLDHGFYDRGCAFLQTNGFRFLADEEDVTLKGTFADLRTFIRIMLSADGTVTAALYHPKPRLLVRLLLRLSRTRLGKIVDLETEFSDGTFLCTTNAKAASGVDLPGRIQCEYCVVDTPISDILSRHHERFRDYAAENASVHALALDSLADVHASQHRQEALKATHRQSIGGPTRQELEHAASGDRSIALEVHAEIERRRGADDPDRQRTP